MKTISRILMATLIASLSTVWPASLAAQTVITADWTNLGKTSLEVVGDGEVLDVGVNRITIDQNAVTDGDANDGDFTNFYSTGMLSYFAGQISGQTGTLLYSIDSTQFDVGDFFETTYAFDTSVTNLEFTVGNVDRFFGNVNFQDGVVIEYDTGNGVWQNLRDLGGATTIGSALATTTIGGQDGWHGTAFSGSLASTTGDIAVDFGNTTVERVRIRYLFGQDQPGSDPTGDWQFLGLSDFTWQQAGITTADLSLTKLVSNGTPTTGDAVDYTLRLTNSGTGASSNVDVRDALPTGFAFSSASGFGTYNPSTGLWNVPTIAPGQTREIILSGTVTAPAGVTITNTAEVFATPNSFDPDSSPNNNQPGEDDQASAPFTVQGTRTAGIAPTLICPAGTLLFDWDSNPWPAGTLSNDYTLPGFGTLNYTIASDGNFESDAAFGGQTPALATTNTGGLTPVEQSLHQFIDFATQAQTATTTITLPNGIAGAQFTVFDIDFAANDFADQLTVTGSYKGGSVVPTLTNGTANFVIGNVATGDAGSDGASSDGNVVVTFDEAVDTITIVYGNASTAPTNPDGQAISLHDVTYCRPDTSVSVLKTSAVFSDPVNGSSDPKAIPRALIEYTILVSNTGISDTDEDSVLITDMVPDETKLCLSDMAGSGSGPVRFIDGTSSSSLDYTFAALDDLLDDLEFSNDDGASFAYEPVLDADGCDEAITDFRVRPDGAFAGDSSFSLRARFMIL